MGKVNTYKSNSHSRYLLQFHLIFVCKYRRKLMCANNIAGDIKKLSVKTMKSYITYHMWQKYPNYLSKCFWNEHTLFSDGYFLASVGNVSQDVLKEYIENQGT